MNDSKSFFTATEVAILLNISEAALRSAIRRGEFPPAGFQRRGRHMWSGEVVRQHMDNWRQPRSIVNRARCPVPSSAESR
jgi:hypothetical protein